MTLRWPRFRFGFEGKVKASLRSSTYCLILYSKIGNTAQDDSPIAELRECEQSWKTPTDKEE